MLSVNDEIEIHCMERISQSSANSFICGKKTFITKDEIICIIKPL